MLALTTALSLALHAAPVPAPVMEVAVPFGCGRAFPVSQTHNTGSHLQNDTWAWDFRMPEGTPIVAAADGVVRMARGDNTQGACDPAYAKFANYVVITHSDGYETQYLHFSSVVVRPGDRVRSGQLIGFSGSTGWSCGAHLHFKVAKAERPGWNNPSVPATIVGYGDPVVETIIAAPACKGPEILLASGKEPAKNRPVDAPSAATTDDVVAVATATPELAAAGVQPTSDPGAGVPPPMGRDPSAAGGGGGSPKK